MVMGMNFTLIVEPGAVAARCESLSFLPAVPPGARSTGP